MNNFYVYIYLDPRKIGQYKYGELIFGYEPFYVGKGKNNRCINGLKDRKLCLKITKIKSIRESNLEPIILKIANNLTENQAFLKEIELIDLIGRIENFTGPLTNMTNGGEGDTGYKHKQKWKSILSKPVLQYKGEEFIAEYSSIKEASEKTRLIPQNIGAVLNGKYKQTGGFIFKLKNPNDVLQGHIKSEATMPKHSAETILKMKESAKRGDNHPQKNKMGKNNPSSKRTIQLTLDDKEVKIWDSVMDIKRELGFTPSNISRCCHGTVKRIGGFKWKYLIP